MTGIVEFNEQQRRSLQKSVHAECIVCRSAQAQGLDLQLHANKDGSVEGEFDCRSFFQGYDGIVHGGVISMILDGAMTQCLFAQGKCGVTARLILRFLQPLEVDRPARVKAWLCDCSPPLYVLEAELSQEESVRARATAKFIDRDLVQPRGYGRRTIPPGS